MKSLCALVLLMSLPLMAAVRQQPNIYVSQYDNVLPQVADGGGWSSRITLVNMDSVAASFTVSFFHEDGTPWNIALKDQSGAQAVWTFALPVGGSLFLETPGTDTQTNVGWALLTSNNWVSGVGAFKGTWLATNDMEAVVPFASQYDGIPTIGLNFYIPFDNRAGYVTSLALVNSSSTAPCALTIQFLNPDGSILYTDNTITLDPLHHMSFETTNQYPQTAGKNGAIVFTVTSGNGASALGLLFNDNRHSFTSIHSLSILPAQF
jgi:hypothetical protein